MAVSKWLKHRNSNDSSFRCLPLKGDYLGASSLHSIISFIKMMSSQKNGQPMWRTEDRKYSQMTTCHSLNLVLPTCHISEWKGHKRIRRCIENRNKFSCPLAYTEIRHWSPAHGEIRILIYKVSAELAFSISCFQSYASSHMLIHPNALEDRLMESSKYLYINEKWLTKSELTGTASQIEPTNLHFYR